MRVGRVTRERLRVEVVDRREEKYKKGAEWGEWGYSSVSKGDERVGWKSMSER